MRAILFTIVLSLSLSLSWPAVPASADGPSQSAREIRSERVLFQKGSTGTTIRGKVAGYDIVDYIVRANSGQTIAVAMHTDSGATYFNVLAPGETEVAFFNGSISDNAYEGTLDQTGDYRIRIYQMRSAARRGEVAHYRLRLHIE